MKQLIALVCLAAIPLFAAACGQDDEPANSAPAAPTDTVADPTPAPPPELGPQGSAPAAHRLGPCDRAMCNDFDQRDWRVNPPPDEQVATDQHEQEADNPTDVRVLTAREHEMLLNDLRVKAIRVNAQTQVR